jgi:AraC-like DNA-binding protein
MGGMHDRAHTHALVEGPAGQILAYVNEHLFEEISIQSIADAFYRSPSQISRIFQQATGNSLWKYVTIKRLMSARELIQRGEPAAVAATACGFSEYSSFYRAYKGHFGHSPKADA